MRSLSYCCQEFVYFVSPLLKTIRSTHHQSSARQTMLHQVTGIHSVLVHSLTLATRTQQAGKHESARLAFLRHDAGQEGS